MSERVRVAAAVLIVAIVAGCVAVSAQTQGGDLEGSNVGEAITLADYLRELRRIETQLKAGHGDEALGLARALRGRKVICPREEIEPDPALLQAIEEAKGRATQGVARRVERLARALESVEPGEPAEARPEVLAAIRRLPQVAAAGRVALPEARIPSVGERLLAWVDQVVDSIWSRWQAFQRWAREWLRRFWPRRRAGGPGLQSTTVVTLVVIALATVILAVTALRAWRARGPGPVPSVPVVPAESALDADPLSRESNEWEGYAQELSRLGRRREAIRAWYHAVLVALFRGGYLHHERGRTNWEYAARLGPELSWRPVFLDLTRQFDREWYGRVVSSAEALAGCARAARAILREIPTEAAS